MVSSGKTHQPKSRPAANSEADVVSKMKRLKKSVKNCNMEIQSLKRRLFAVTKELRALKKDRDCHLKKIKQAERIDRKLEAEKSKLKRKVLKTEDVKKAAKDMGNTTV